MDEMTGETTHTAQTVEEIPQGFAFVEVQCSSSRTSPTYEILTQTTTKPSTASAVPLRQVDPYQHPLGQDFAGLLMLSYPNAAGFFDLQYRIDESPAETATYQPLSYTNAFELSSESSDLDIQTIISAQQLTLRFSTVSEGVDAESTIVVDQGDSSFRAFILNHCTQGQSAQGRTSESISESTSVPSGDGEIDFGDDSGNWSLDGECDDPRFEGDAMAPWPMDEDVKKDATDCRNAFRAGQITFKD